jgi:DNA-directed RNA polymerase specialized sigma24 family protein
LADGGNELAFDALFRRHETRLLVFCRELLNSREAADRVLRDTRAHAFAFLATGGAPMDVRPWLYRIARERCLVYLRHTDANARTDPHRTVVLLHGLEALSPEQVAAVIRPTDVAHASPQRPGSKSPAAGLADATGRRTK